jgi:hypothetical protein
VTSPKAPPAKQTFSITYWTAHDDFMSMHANTTMPEATVLKFAGERQWLTRANSLLTDYEFYFLDNFNNLIFMGRAAVTQK